MSPLYHECSLRDIRWALFVQKRKEGQQLPPTLETLIPRVHRAFYFTQIWKISQTPCPQFPSSTHYYWELLDGKLTPVSCVNPLAPEALLELRKCNFKKGVQRGRVDVKKKNCVAHTCVDAGMNVITLYLIGLNKRSI